MYNRSAHLNAIFAQYKEFTPNLIDITCTSTKSTFTGLPTQLLEDHDRNRAKLFLVSRGTRLVGGGLKFFGITIQSI